LYVSIVGMGAEQWRDKGKIMLHAGGANEAHQSLPTFSSARHSVNLQRMVVVEENV
jgi:hypothetical protein